MSWTRAAIVVGEVLAVGALLAGMVVWPPLREPGRADAVVLLSGDGDRLPTAQRLLVEGAAPRLVFVGVPDTIAVADLCRQPQPFEVTCLQPRPDNTRSEARVTARLARERAWNRIIVVTSRYHIARARLLFRRCFAGDVQAVGDYPAHGAAFARRQVVHEWLALVHASVLARGC